MNEVILKYKKYNGKWSQDIEEVVGGAQVALYCLMTR